MAWVGEMLVKGLAGSIDKNGDMAVRAAEGMSSDVSSVMNSLTDDMKTALPTDFSIDGNIKKLRQHTRHKRQCRRTFACAEYCKF